MRRGWVALLALAALGCPSAAADLDERIPARPGGVLEVDLDFGDGLRPDPGELDIRVHDTNEVHVTSEADGWGTYGVRLRLEREDDRVRLVGRVSGSTTWLFGGPRVEVTIRVPREFRVDARTSAGPVRVEDVSGRVRVRTDAGDIEVSGVEGSVRLRAEDGTLRVSDTVGAVDARTASGDVHIHSVTGDVDVRTGRGPVEVERVSGRVEARTDRGTIDLVDIGGPVQVKTERGAVFASFLGDPAGSIETSRGPVEVALPADTSARLETRTPRGELEVARSLAAREERDGDSATLHLGRGGAPLQIYSARGGVRVRAR